MSLITLIRTDNISEIERTIVSKACDVEIEDPAGIFPLEHAVVHGNIEIVKKLLEVCKEYHRSLIYAIKENKTEIFKILIEAGAEIDGQYDEERFEGWTPLMYAAYLGKTQMIKLLSKTGADLEISDSSGRTALVISAQFGQNLAVSTLIRLGANINHRDITNSSALSYACRAGHQWMLDRLRQAEEVEEIEFIRASGDGDLRKVKFFIKKIAEINCKNLTGESALCIACRKGHISVVEALIFAGANINLTSNGFTPLMRAVDNGRLKIAQILIASGADINIKNSGFDAYTYAQLNRNKKMIQLIEEARSRGV